MALYIGFANTFYTLWDVTARIDYGQASHGEVYSYETVTYTYLQNLSLDLATAQEKAKARGCKDLEPNHDLFGKNKSWENRNSRNYCSFYDSVTPYHPQTNESLSLISADEVMALYKSWHFCSNIHVINRGIELGLLVRDADGEVMTQQEYASLQARLDRRAMYKRMFETGETKEIVVTASRNLSPCPIGAYLQTEEHGYLYFSDYKEMYYSGFAYGLPIDSKGKAKRIKGKELTLTIEVRNISGEYEVFVKEFKL